MTRFSTGDSFAAQLCRGGTFLLRHVACFLAALDTIWLSIGFLPFIYVMAAYAAYESSFIRIDFFLSESESSSRRRVKLALLTT